MFNKSFHEIDKVLAWVAGTGLLIMMLLTFADVIGRYGFNKSIFGTAEYVEMLMVVTIFSGIALISASNEHITVSIFEGWIQKRFPNLQRWSVLIFTLLVYGGITYELLLHAFKSLERGKLTPVLSFPHWYLPMTAGILSLCGLVLFAVKIARTGGHMDRLDRQNQNEAVGKTTEGGE